MSSTYIYNSLLRIDRVTKHDPQEFEYFENEHGDFMVYELDGFFDISLQSWCDLHLQTLEALSKKLKTSGVESNIVLHLAFNKSKDSADYRLDFPPALLKVLARMGATLELYSEP